MSFHIYKKCPFGRLLIRLDLNKNYILKMIFDYVLEINAIGLNLDHYAENVQRAALSTYKLSKYKNQPTNRLK
jgi:hypothetical protein